MLKVTTYLTCIGCSIHLIRKMQKANRPLSTKLSCLHQLSLPHLHNCRQKHVYSLQASALVVL